MSSVPYVSHVPCLHFSLSTQVSVKECFYVEGHDSTIGLAQVNITGTPSAPNIGRVLPIPPPPLPPPTHT